MGRGRRCINPECDRPLRPHEQGALCSQCFYTAICTPGPADTTGVQPDEPPQPRELTRLDQRRARRGF